MVLSKETFLSAATRLHDFIEREHWNGSVLIGPDRGVRFNARIGRFIKSYLAFLPWSDNHVYQQAQGYWMLSNWLMYDLLRDERYRDIAHECSRRVQASQQPEGYWTYSDREWKGRIATVEGDFAAIGLLESYSRTGDESLLNAAGKWYQYLVDVVGFEEEDGLLAVNYFANYPTARVPNNSTLTLVTLAKLNQATNEARYLDRCDGMIQWLRQVQLPTGELPYSVSSTTRPGRQHLLCYQYNAFEFLDLADYYRITENETIWPVLEGLAAYLSTGITQTGYVRYDCHSDKPAVVYYTAAAAAALSQAAELGLGDYRAQANLAYQWVLAQQREDGGMRFFSRGSYRLLTDRRSYPRNVAMILYHLLLEVQRYSHTACLETEDTGVNEESG